MALGDYNPFPTEEAQQEDRPGFMPHPVDHWYNGLSGMFSTDAKNVPDDPISRGIGQGEAKAMSLLSGAVHGVADGVDASSWAPAAKQLWGYEPGSIQNITDQVDAFSRARVAQLAPNPKTNGLASQMIQGLADVGSTATLATIASRGAGGGAAITGAVEGYSKYRDMLDMGIDKDTAQRLGMLEGVTTSAALVTPYSLPLKALGFTGNGVRMATQMLTGATVNVGLSGFDRFASHKVLLNAGYTGMARQYEVMDGTAMVSDAALGAIFGYLGDHGSVKAKEFQTAVETAIKGHEHTISTLQDAAMTVRLAHIDATDLSPGLPGTPGAAGAHVRAMEQALADISSGRPVDVSRTGVDQETFVPKPESEPSVSAAEILKDEFKQADVLKVYSALDKAERALAERRGEVLPPPEAPRMATPAPEAPAPAPEPVHTATAEVLPALPKRNFKTPDAREDSIIQYMAKHERGISSIEGEAQGLDPADMERARVGIKRAFRKKGMSFDEAAETLHGAGYPVSDEHGYNPNTLLERLDDELRGHPHQSVHNTRALAEHEADMMHDDAMRAEAERAAPEFAKAAPEVQDMTALAARAHEHDPDATEAALESQADDSTVRERLEAIIAAGRSRAEHAAALREQSTRPAPVSERKGGGEVLPAEDTSGARRDHALVALAERPDLKIVDADGNEVSGAAAHQLAEVRTQQAEAEAPKMFDAAVNCAMRTS